jgi:hypothetical protein
MPFTYQSAVNQAANLLGKIVGNDPATAEANFLLPLNTARTTGPDFTPSAFQMACENTIADIIQTICETRFHPERADYSEDTDELASGDLLPSVSASAKPLIGIMGMVRDKDTGLPLKEVAIDRVMSEVRFANSIYKDADLYHFAIHVGANTIEHTRDKVIIEWPAMTRPSFVANNPVPLRDWHERGVVAGILTFLAPKEDMYSGLFNAESGLYAAHLTQIRALGGQEGQPPVAKAPSVQ